MMVRAFTVSAAVVTAVVVGAPASAFEIARAKTQARVDTSASGAEIVRLTFVAELVNERSPAVPDDVVVGWQEVGGIEPTPFRILIPAGCFMDRRGRGFYVSDFSFCGVQMSVGSSARGFALLEIVDFQARIVRDSDGTSRFDIVTRFVPPDPIIPPDPIVPPDPVRAFLGIVGGAAVEIAIGSESSAVAPLRTETVSGVEPEPF